MANSLSARDTSIDRSILFSVAQQAILLILGALMPDGDDVAFRYALCATIAYWISLFIFVIRRNRHYTSNNRFLIRWGFLFLYSAIILGTVLVAHLRGY